VLKARSFLPWCGWHLSGVGWWLWGRRPDRRWWQVRRCLQEQCGLGGGPLLFNLCKLLCQQQCVFIHLLDKLQHLFCCLSLRKLLRYSLERLLCHQWRARVELKAPIVNQTWSAGSEHWWFSPPNRSEENKREIEIRGSEVCCVERRSRSQSCKQSILKQKLIWLSSRKTSSMKTCGYSWVESRRNLDGDGLHPVDEET
jgi:hypothetical protein